MRGFVAQSTNIVDFSGYTLLVGELRIGWDSTAGPGPATYVHHLAATTNVIEAITATTVSTVLPGGLSVLSALMNNFNKLVADMRNTKEVLNGICHDLHRQGVIPQ